LCVVVVIAAPNPVAVGVGLFVVAPGAVAALGSGNAAVAVIKPGNEHARPSAATRIAGVLHFRALEVDRVTHRN
jgi:hypothetical protein